MTVRPEFRPGAVEEINRSPRVDLRRRAVAIAIDLAAGRLTGQPLDDDPSTGDLSDCFKGCSDDEDVPPRHRMVYRLKAGSVEAARRPGRLDE